MEISRPLRIGAIPGSKHGNRLWWLESERATSFIAVLVTVGALVALAVSLGHFTGFYSIDGDIKYLAALNIVHHPLNPWISYPFRRVDPSGQFSLPLTAWYTGHDYAGYSLPFEYIAALFLAVFGKAGVVLPAIAATALILIIQTRLASLVGLTGQRPLVVFITVASTPILFYSISFWEHTWGVALLLAGLALLLETASRHDCPLWLAPLGGSVYAGAVLMRRDTLIPAVLSLLILPLLFPEKRTLLISALAGLGMCLPIGLILQLHPEPLALGLTHASPGRAGIGVRAGVTKFEKLQWLLAGGPATGLLAVLSVALFLAKRFRPRWVIPTFSAGSLVAGVALVVQMLSHYTFADENPLAFCPLAIWGLWAVFLPATHVGERAAARALWLLAATGAVAIVLVAYDDGGAQWGPRYLLFVFPLLVLLGLRARQELTRSATGIQRRVINYSFVGVVGLSILVQGLGVFALSIREGLAATADARVASTGASLVVSTAPIIDVLAPSYESGTYLYAPTQRSLDTLMAIVRRRGDRRLVILCDTVSACNWKGYPGWKSSPLRSVGRLIRYSVLTR